MVEKYSKELIEKFRQMFVKYTEQSFTDSDIEESIDNISKLINYLNILNDKYFNNKNGNIK